MGLHQKLIWVGSRSLEMRYTETYGLIEKIEIFDDAFHVDPNKDPEWVDVGALFNIFVGYCESDMGLRNRRIQ